MPYSSRPPSFSDGPSVLVSSSSRAPPPPLSHPPSSLRSPSSSSSFIAGRKRSHTFFCSTGEDEEDGLERESSYYGSEFDRHRLTGEERPGSDRADDDEREEDEELEEERALRRIEERLKRRRGEPTVDSTSHETDQRPPLLPHNPRVASPVDSSPPFSTVILPLRPPATSEDQEMQDDDHAILNYRSPPAARMSVPTSAPPAAGPQVEQVSTQRARWSPPPSPSSSAMSSSDNSISSSFSPAGRFATPSTSALPLSMRRRPPLVRNATAVPVPLSPEVSLLSSLAHAQRPEESARSYFHPTPPQTAPRPSTVSVPAGPSTLASLGFSEVDRQADEASPTTGSTFVSRNPVFGPRRPGALDATGRLRGPSRAANESWLGIRTRSPPPIVSPAEAGGTFDRRPLSEEASSLTTSRTELAERSSSGRSNARSWAPIGSSTSPLGSFAVRQAFRSDSWRDSLPESTTSEQADDVDRPPTIGLRPFRLRPGAVTPSQPITSSSSTTAQRTGLLAQLGLASEGEHIESDLGSFGISRSRFNTLQTGTARRRRPTPTQVDETAEAMSEEAPPLDSWGAEPPMPVDSRSRGAAPSAPLLSFLRPLQLPLADHSTPLASSSSSRATTPRRSTLAPPILTSAFRDDDEDDEESGLPLSFEADVPAPPLDYGRLNPQTRLPVILSSGLASPDSAGTVLPSFSSAVASDWSSPPTGPSFSAARQTPTLRPRSTTDFNFSERFSSSAAAVNPSPSSSTHAGPSSSFSPFSDAFTSTSAGAARPTLSPETASTSTGSGLPSAAPSGAGSRLAEYLSRHNERRRQLLPDLAERGSGRGERDEWASLMDLLNTPSSALDSEPLVPAHTSEQLAARRRRLAELRLQHARSASLPPGPSSSNRPPSFTPEASRPRESTSNLTRTLEALGTRHGHVPSSIWDALMYPAPPTTQPHHGAPYAGAGSTFRHRQTFFAGLRAAARGEEAAAATPFEGSDDRTLHAAGGDDGLTRRAHDGGQRSFFDPPSATFQQATASGSSNLGRPSNEHVPFYPFGVRNRTTLGGDGVRPSHLPSGVDPTGSHHPVAFTSLFSFLSQTPNGGIGTGEFATEDDIDLSYEGLLELTARIPDVRRGTPEWVVKCLRVASYRDVLVGREGTEGEADGRCAICLDDYQPHDLTMTLPCRHFLHKDCLEEWLKGSHMCPLCRADVLSPSGPSWLPPALPPLLSDPPGSSSLHRPMEDDPMSASRTEGLVAVDSADGHGATA